MQFYIFVLFRLFHLKKIVYQSLKNLLTYQIPNITYSTFDYQLCISILTSCLNSLLCHQNNIKMIYSSFQISIVSSLCFLKTLSFECNKTFEKLELSNSLVNSYSYPTSADFALGNFSSLE